MSDYTPIPTEYKGTRFRSKSEAVFARFLDLVEASWVYEPSEHFGHVWDFIVFPEPVLYRHHSMRLQGEFFISSDDVGATPQPIENKPFLVEYKPSMPTNTYIDNLRKSMRRWECLTCGLIQGDGNCDDYKPCPNCGKRMKRTGVRESFIVWGNPWDGIPDIEFCDDNIAESYIAFPIFSDRISYGMEGYDADFQPWQKPIVAKYDLTNSHVFSTVLQELFGTRLEPKIQDAKRYRFDLQNGGQYR